ncbi:hypothetical protein TWF696_001376 [Orbilia brochopaga]|uniref:RING-type domain-containing protein n=1 Tax=Orbilia brochopaga TaxID=3140254 RepID=A0AAV9U8S8_9PEZI
MTSTGNLSLGSKAQQASPASQNIQSFQSSSDQQLSSQQRSSSGGGANVSGTRGQASPRNNQANKAKHKKHRRPGVQQDEAIAEAIAMTSSSTISRKGRTSITHLMDWSLPPPRPQHANNHYSRGHHGNRRHTSWGMGSGYHSVDKARYVNANYRFIVDPTGDYKSQSLDPDSPLPWTSVLQILASSITQAASCPICLCDPVAPRMARCGHIFCFPCLIRYMASEDDAPKPGQQGYYHPTANQNKQKWKKCPICHDSVYMNEVRPVKFYQGQEAPPPREGSDVMLRLMMRQPGSTLALPKDVAGFVFSASGNKKENLGAGDAVEIPWHYTAEVTDYARVMKGTKSYLEAEYEREIAELEEQERVDELMFGDETDWVKKAIGKIRSAMEKIKDMPDKEEERHDRLLPRELYERHLLEESSARAEKMRQREPIAQQSEHEVPDMYLATSSSAQHGVDHRQDQPSPEMASQVSTSTAAEPETTKAVPAPPKSPTRRRHAPTKPIDAHDPTQPYFFYQALPHSYLSPLDIRILKVAFGSFSAFPSTVLPRVENFSMGHVVDDELRKRARYLSHLPYGCEVAFLECDWADIVPKEILERFQPDLERRIRRKREKDNREERERARAEREEDEKRWSAARKDRAARGGLEDELGMAMEISRREFDVANGGVLFETPEEEEGSVPNGPKLGFGSLPQSSPPSSRTVWGTPAVAGGEASEPREEHKENKADSPWLDGWEKEAVAIEQAVRNTASGSGGGGNKGKKKFKKVTLMTNTGKRGA